MKTSKVQSKRRDLHHMWLLHFYFVRWYQKLQFMLVLLLEAGGIYLQLVLFMSRQRLFPLGMTNFFHSVIQVDKNINI